MLETSAFESLYGGQFTSYKTKSSCNTAHLHGIRNLHPLLHVQLVYKVVFKVIKCQKSLSCNFLAVILFLIVASLSFSLGPGSLCTCFYGDSPSSSGKQRYNVYV